MVRKDSVWSFWQDPEEESQYRPLAFRSKVMLPQQRTTQLFGGTAPGTLWGPGRNRSLNYMIPNALLGHRSPAVVHLKMEKVHLGLSPSRTRGMNKLHEQVAQIYCHLS